MKIVFLSNIFHHLQKPLADELYELTSGNYVFVETDKMKSGLAYKGEKASYVIPYNDDNKSEVERLVYDADVVIYGEAPISLIKRRLCAGKLTFSDVERCYKHINRYLKWPVYTYNSLSLNKGYLLCASAYASRDFFYSGMSMKKCFKWGYFPAIREYDDVETVIKAKRSATDGVIQLFWTGRLIKCKHPESALFVAKILKEKGYKFEIKIVGYGPLKETLEKKLATTGLGAHVKFLGVQPPEIVRDMMEKSDIYLFTSDRGEGWGAVLNESMNSACAVVASPASGSSPFLIKDSVNALFYKDKNWEDLCNKVLWLIDHKDERVRMGREAYYTMLNIWNAKTAAKNLMKLISAIQEHKDAGILDGPCSPAVYLPQNWR
jgi:glycosyltransferase involved in cell wall biosynthesis